MLYAYALICETSLKLIKESQMTTSKVTDETQAIRASFDELIPQGVIFNLRQIEEWNILNISMAKKLIGKGEIEVVKIGNKLHISRTVLIEYLVANTIPAAA